MNIAEASSSALTGGQSLYCLICLVMLVTGSIRLVLYCSATCFFGIYISVKSDRRYRLRHIQNSYICTTTIHCIQSKALNEKLHPPLDRIQKE